MTDLQIAEPTHPLAAGLANSVTVLTPGAGLYGFGVPGPGAVNVAAPVGGTAGRFAIFGDEQGAEMVSLRLLRGGSAGSSTKRLRGGSRPRAGRFSMRP